MDIESIVGIAAIGISLASLGFTWFSLKYQREHNYKSVKPIGEIVVGDYEDKIFVRIDNCGIGPLIIKRFTAKNSGACANSVIEIIPTSISESIIWSNFAAGLEGKTIPHGNKLCLIEYTINYNEDLSHKEFHEQNKIALRKFLKDVTLELEYTDIYEQNVFKTSRLLDWFGRHFKG